MEITEKLFELQDLEYRDFAAKLSPNVSKELFIGVRIPEVRKLAKECYKNNDYKEFIKVLPHKYFDEYMIHGLILSEFKDYESCIKELDRFLPYVDNWAVCDICNPKCFKKNKDKLINKIKIWLKSDKIYVVRFSIGMLMGHFLDEDFKKEYLDLCDNIITNEYYINMMIAWYFATALAKQYDSTITYLENYKLPKWVHNKTIQKAIESYRITPNQKEYLKTLKIK